MAKHAVIELAVVHAGDIGRFLGRVHVFFVHMLVIRMGVVMLFVRRGLRFLFRAVSCQRRRQIVQGRGEIVYRSG